MHRIRAAAAGAIVSLALAACQGGVEGETGAPTVAPVSPAASPTQGDLMSPAASPDASPMANQLFPVFQAAAGSDLTGGAIITDVGGESSVVIGVVAPSAAEIMLPVAIVEGDCTTQTGQGPVPPPDMFPAAEASPGASPDAGVGASPAASPIASPAASPGASPGGPVEFPIWLTPIEFGTSNSVIPVGVDQLTAAPHALIVETSPDDPTIQACADLEEGLPAPASPGASPDTGVGASPDAGASPMASPASS